MDTRPASEGRRVWPSFVQPGPGGFRGDSPPLCHRGGCLCPGVGQSFPCRPPSPSDQSDKVRTGAAGREAAPQAASEPGCTASRPEGAGGEHPSAAWSPLPAGPGGGGAFQNEPCGNVLVPPAPARDHRGPCSLYLECPSWHPGLLHKGPDWHSGRERERAAGGRLRGRAGPPGTSKPGWGVSDHRASRRWRWEACAVLAPDR